MHVELGLITEISDVDRLIDESFNGTCFAYSWFLKLKNSDIILKIFDKDNILIGFMPVFKSDDKNVIFQSTMYIPYGGPVIFCIPKEERNKIRYIRDIEKTLSGFLINNYKKVDFSTDNEIIDIMPFIRNEFVPEVRYTYKIDLSLGLEKIYSNFGSDRKKDIRRANKKNYKIIIDDELKYFSSKAAMKWEANYGEESTYDFVEHFVRESIDNNKGKCFVALNEENKVAGAVHIVWDTHSAYILYSYYERASDDVAIAFIYYKIIEYLINNKTTNYLDFEGSVFEEIEDWNISFGAYQSRFYNLHWSLKEIDYKNIYNYGNK